MPLSAEKYAQKAEKLFVLPDIYVRLKEIIDDERSSTADIANIIALDPGLSSQLLKIANSALFNFSKRVDSISRAISILGLNEVKNLIDTFGTTAAFQSMSEDVIDLDRFWEVSVDCALLCKYLADKKKIKKGKGLFLSGLLHNVGELVIAQQEPLLAKYCEKYDKNEKPWQRQYDVLKFTYADCSTELLKLWQLPENIIKPISQFHHAYSEELDDDCSLLYICSRLALINSHPGMYSKKTFLGQHLMKELDITMADIDEALNFCNLEGLAILSALKLKK
jgi:HD-like signal output (HDOD) protein